MSSECSCGCEPVDFGDCSRPGGGFIDESGVFYLEPAGIHECISPQLPEQHPNPDANG